MEPPQGPPVARPPSRRALRVFGWAVGASVLAAAAPRVSRAQELAAPPGFEAAVYEVRVSQAERTTLPALMNGRGEVLVPLRRVIALTGLAIERAAAELRVPDVGGTGVAALDTVAGRLTRRDTVVQLAASELAFAGGELYVTAAALAPFLRAEVSVQQADLTVVVSRVIPFPAERDAMLAAQRRAAAGPGAVVSHVPYGSANGGAVIDWGVSTSGTDLRRSSGVDGQIGLAVLGGELTAGGYYVTNVLGEGSSRGTGNYRRVFPGGRVVQQVQAGDLVAGAALLRPMRGALVTNSPLVRHPDFSQVPVLPAVPAGWQYEVYQGGQLVGYSDAASRAPVLVPLRYGTTPMQVRLLSPAGDEIVSNLLYQVPMSQLPPGTFEYSLGGGRCPEGRCGTMGFATASYGVRRWLTAQGGLESAGDSSGRRLQPHGAVSAASLDGWGAQLQAMRGTFTRAALQYYGAGRLNGDLAVGTNHPGAGQMSFVAGATPRWYVDSRLAERLARARLGVHALRIEGRAEGPSGGPMDRWRAALAADFPRGRAGLERERSPGSEPLTSATLLVLAPQGAPAWARNAAVQSAVGANGLGVRATELSVSLSHRRYGSLSTGWRWAALGNSNTASLVYTASLGFARATSRVTNAWGMGTQASTTLSGSATVNQRFGVTAVDRSGMGSGGIGGAVFYDRDGDGHLGAGDTRVPGARVFVSGRQTVTNERGEYHLWHEQPYEIAVVSVDTLDSLEPEWTPSAPRLLVRPTPHRFTEVNVPLVRTREVSGRVVAGTGVATAAGVTLTLVNRATGAREAAVTFSDGEYYLSRVRPGEYDLVVEPTALAALAARVAAPPRPVTVPLQGIDVVTIPDIRLEAAGTP